jgi:hypothetical protein
MYDIKVKTEAVSLVYPEFITKVVQLSLIVSVVGYYNCFFYNYSVYSFGCSDKIKGIKKLPYQYKIIMKNSTLIKNVNIVNEGQIKIADVLFKMVLSNILGFVERNN